MKKSMFTLLFSVLFFSKITANEKIYAIMITGKDLFHKRLAEQSIASFFQQTYPNKHLIIINDGDYSFEQFNGDYITEIRVPHKMALGALRNLGLKKVPGNAVWIQWDDDDWHHPMLIEEQYNYLINKKAFGVLLNNQVRYCFFKNSAWTKRAVLPGTIMCRKKDGLYYPQIAKAEDSKFLKDLKKSKKIVTWDNPPHYYLRFIHGHNTWQTSHFKMDNYKDNTFYLQKKSKTYLKYILKNNYWFLKQEHKRRKNETGGSACSSVIFSSLF